MTDPSHPARTTEPSAAHGFPRWVWATYVLLFGLSVPWYWTEGAELRMWLGLPHWVVSSLAATLAIAVFTALVVHRYWPDEEDADR